MCNFMIVAGYMAIGWCVGNMLYKKLKSIKGVN